MAAQLEISFTALVVSLATSAAVHFGDAADPSSGQRGVPNLDAAGHMVELVAVLAEKTRGNLTQAEEQFLTRVLYELQMRLIDARKSEGRAGAP